MKTCPTCGFDLWSYNSTTLTCKHGHRFDTDLKPVPAQPVYVAKPQQIVPYTQVVERRQPVLLAAACGAAAALVVDVIWMVLA